MPSITDALLSQVGRKILSGLTGLFLLFFVIFHLIGNLAIFGSPDAMNAYSMMVHDFGPLLWVARIGSVLIFVVHAWVGIPIWLRNSKARPHDYNVYSSKVDPSRQSLSTRSIAFTVVILTIFVILHVNTFALGDTGDVVLDGRTTHDIKTLVVDTFQDPVYAFGYAIAMVLLDTHLGHGIWSAFVSLGMSSR